MAHKADDTIRQLILDGINTTVAMIDAETGKLQQSDTKSANTLRANRQELLQLAKAVPTQNTSELLTTLLKLSTKTKTGELWSVRS